MVGVPWCPPGAGLWKTGTWLLKQHCERERERDRERERQRERDRQELGFCNSTARGRERERERDRNLASVTALPERERETGTWLWQQHCQRPGRGGPQAWGWGVEPERAFWEGGRTGPSLSRGRALGGGGALMALTGTGGGR